MGNGLKGMGTTHPTPIMTIMAVPAVIPKAMTGAVTKATARTTPRTTA